MRLARFLVKMETIDESVVIRSMNFFIRNFFRIKCRELIDSNYVKVFDQFFVNLAAMNLKYANISCRLFIKVDLFRNAVYQIANNAILCDKDFKWFLYIVKGALCFPRAVLTSLLMPSLSHITFIIFLVS